MHFTKMQGVGNDFAVIDAHDVAATNLPELAVRLCARGFSIGADGLLVVGATNSSAAFTFRMFNPDGSEDMCGNGLRCASLWAYRHGLVKLGEFEVSTKDDIRKCELISVSDKEAIARVDMGAPRFAPSELPLISSNPDFIEEPIQVLDREFLATVVNTGSTHTIIFLEEPVDEEIFAKYSPALENHPNFPERTSVLWTVQTGPDQYSTRIWERGAGETLGCGTGACAVAVAAVVTHRTARDMDITVSSKGGDLIINWAETVWMTGPAALVYDGEIGEDTHSFL
jgi:diaminopimelate epimerase